MLRLKSKPICESSIYPSILFKYEFRQCKYHKLLTHIPKEVKGVINAVFIWTKDIPQTTLEVHELGVVPHQLIYLYIYLNPQIVEEIKL